MPIRFRSKSWLVVTALCLSGCGVAPNPARLDEVSSANSIPLVRVVPVRPVKKTLVRRTEQPGRVEAFEEAPLYARVAGYVARMHVDIGDQVVGPRYDNDGKIVTPGEILAELSVPELEAEFRQKGALVVQAEAEVRQATAGIKVAEAMQATAQAKLDETLASIDRAQADYDRYRSEFTRIRELAEQGSVNRQVADEKENLLRAADAARKEVAAQVSSAKAGVAQAESFCEKAKSDAEAAQARLGVCRAEEQRVGELVGYTRIRAPFDGTISVRNADTGHFVQPAMVTTGKPLLTVIRTDVVRVFVDVPEVDAVLTQKGNEARLRVPALTDGLFVAEITRSSWRLDPATRTLRAEIDIENSARRLLPGMYVNADLKVAERTDAVTLPHTAVFTFEGQTSCFIIDEQGRVRRQGVGVGLRSGDDLEIVSGLQGHELVIGTNPAAFRDGQHVEPVTPESPRR